MPVVFLLGSIAHFSVNVVMADHLSSMPLVAASHTHAVPWGSLWAQYNQDRSFFPNALVVILAHTDHLDVRVEDFIGGLLLVVGTALVLLAHKRWTPDSPWLYYCPVAFVTLSSVQYMNTFLGGVSWYLTFASLAATIYLLDTRRTSRLSFGGAIVAAVVGSLSSFAGLLIWPTGLVLLYLRRRGWRAFATWVASGAITMTLYFVGFAFNSASHPSPGYLAGHLWTAVQVFLTAIGDVVGITVQPGSGPDVFLLALGALVLGVAAYAVVLGLRNRGSDDGGPVGISLICFGILFALSVTVGRVAFGAAGASASRYTSYDLLVLVGAYLALLGVRGNAVATPAPVRPSGLPDSGSYGDASRSPAPRRGMRTPIACAVALGLMCIQITLGTWNGVKGERTYHQQQVVAATYLRNYRFTPDAKLSMILAPLRTASWIRQNASIAQRYHLSTFSTPAAPGSDPLRIEPPAPVIFKPIADSTVHGSIGLAAGTRTYIGLKEVDFVIDGPGLGAPIREVTKFGAYGWSTLWNTTLVPDGTYSAVAISITYGGKSATSGPIRFHVANS